MPAFEDAQPIIVFDGNCVLCSGWIKFVLKADTTSRFKFIVAQSELGEALYAHFGLKSEDYDTNMLLDKGYVRVKSDGTLAMFAVLGWPWKALNIARIVPNGWRDKIYAHIAKNRIAWFGRPQSCYVPTPEQRARFL